MLLAVRPCRSGCFTVTCFVKSLYIAFESIFMTLLCLPALVSHLERLSHDIAISRQNHVEKVISPLL